MTSGRRSPGDRDAPDVELIVSGRGVSAFAAFYDDLARARRYEPGIEKNARRFNGTVERRGRVTVVYVRGNGDARTRLQKCVF